MAIREDTVTQERLAWEPDTLRTQCPTCGNGFTLTRRKSHCRACGGLFCRDCVNEKISLESFSPPLPGLSKVCSACYHAIRNGQSIKPPPPPPMRTSSLPGGLSSPSSSSSSSPSSSSSSSALSGASSSSSSSPRASPHSVRRSAGGERAGAASPFHSAGPQVGGKAAVERQPWEPDSARQQCSSCNASFSLLLRRHHCRLCGRLFCDACSSKRAPLPFADPPIPTPCRLCDQCFASLP